MKYVDDQSRKRERDRDVDGAVAKIQEVAILQQEMNLIMSGIKSRLLVPGGGLKLTLAFRSKAIVKA